MADNNLRSLSLRALHRADGGPINDDNAGQITLDPAAIAREKRGVLTPPAQATPLVVNAARWQGPQQQSQGLGQVAAPYGPFDMRPTQSQPLVTPYDPQEMDKALGKAADLSMQVALPLGVGALAGPEMFFSRQVLGPAITQAIGSPFTRGDPSVLMGALPNPATPGEDLPEAGLTAEQVLAEAAKKKKLAYADWERKNPGAEEGMFDYANADPAQIGAERGQLPRYAPKRGASARLNDALNNPKVIAAMNQAVEDGAKILPENWYRTGPLYKVFESVLGPDQAPGAYERLMQFVAATSPRSRVPDNLRTASYYYWLDRNNLPLPAKPAAGYGSVAQKLHLQNVTNIQEYGGLDPLKNPKPASFSENLLGNESVLTSDTHNFRFIGMASEDPRFLATSAQKQIGVNPKTDKPIFTKINPRQLYADGKLSMEEALQQPTYWDSAPAKNEYKAVEDLQRQLAQEKGISLADYQGKMWVGGGGPSESRTWSTGLGSPPESFLRTFGKRVQYTAARLKVSPEEVLQKFVSGQIPMLGLGAGAVGVGMLAPHGQQPAATGQEPPQ